MSCLPGVRQALSWIGCSAATERSMLSPTLRQHWRQPRHRRRTRALPRPLAMRRQSAAEPGSASRRFSATYPQIAYRTAYEQVPVTTYRTTTSINPANGLPITCTRPCTSLTAQARRVPYTTYRPVYTTVPVTLPPTSQGFTGVAAAPRPLFRPFAWLRNRQPVTQTLARPVLPTTVVGPGYTPAVGGLLAPAPTQSFSSPGVSSLGTSSAPNPAGATPWTPVTPTPSSLGSGSGVADSPAGATPWQPSHQSSPPGPTPADRPPSLQPAEVPNSSLQLRPVQPPPSLLQQQPADGAAGQNGQRQERGRLFERPNGGSGSRHQSGPGADDVNYGRRPELQGPTNQEARETGRRGFDAGAIPDLERDRRRRDNSFRWPYSNDKTARLQTRDAPRSRTVSDDSSQRVSRYAAMPMLRDVHKTDRHREIRQTWPSRNRDDQGGGPGWTPIR